MEKNKLDIILKAKNELVKVCLESKLSSHGCYTSTFNVNVELSEYVDHFLGKTMLVEIQELKIFQDKNAIYKQYFLMSKQESVIDNTINFLKSYISEVKEFEKKKTIGKKLQFKMTEIVGKIIFMNKVLKTEFGDKQQVLIKTDDDCYFFGFINKENINNDSLLNSKLKIRLRAASLETDNHYKFTHFKIK